MKERPIIFGAEMVRAMLREDNPKTQTRRVIAPQPTGPNPPDFKRPHCLDFYDRRKKWVGAYDLDTGIFNAPCPYGKPGDRLWVRETWADTNGESGPMISYKAGGDRFLVDESYPVDYSLYPGCQFTMWCGDLRRGAEGHKWRHPWFMPRWASRLTLEIVAIRVERLQDISYVDILAEGFVRGFADDRTPEEQALCWYKEVWDRLNGKKHPWESNDWVWVIAFKVVGQCA